MGAFTLVSCGILNSSDNHPPPEIPDNLVLYATVFGQGQGIWTFDPQTLDVQDTLATGSSWSINFSPDYKTVYAAWWDSKTDINEAYAIDAENNEVVKRKEIWNPNVELDRTGTRLIIMGGNPGIQMLDAQTFEILFEGHPHIRNLTAQVAASPVKDEFYALVHIEGQSGVAGVMVFDIETFSIKSVIPLTEDGDRHRSMQGSYIDISPDGRYVYATVFNWQGGGGYGSFHVIDVETGEQVFEAPCGGFAWLGVSPDGRYVYISDSAGTPFHAGGISHEFIPTNTILRYDVNRRRMETFASGAKDIGLAGNLLITSSITVAPDSRSAFIRVLAAESTNEGYAPSIIHIDTRTKKLMNYYRLPPDPDGYIRAWVHQLKFGQRS
jgi:DNA-binding beta-propeller fold protein YncE